MAYIETADANHWRCLNDSIWSELPAPKVVSWKMLHKLKKLDWTQDLIDHSLFNRRRNRVGKSIWR